MRHEQAKKLSMYVATLCIAAVLAGCTKVEESEVSQPSTSTPAPVTEATASPAPTLQPTETPALINIPDSTEPPTPTVTTPPNISTDVYSTANSDTEAISNDGIVTSGLEYKFASYEVTAVSNVTPDIAKAIDSPHIGQDGQAEAGWYVAFADVTVTNISGNDQYVMLNCISIAQIANGSAATGTVSSMRYYDGGTPSSKQYFGVSIGAGETISANVGFLINKDRLGQDDIAFYINPDGVSPANDNTRVVPITITYQ